MPIVCAIDMRKHLFYKCVNKTKAQVIYHGLNMYG